MPMCSHVNESEGLLPDCWCSVSMKVRVKLTKVEAIAARTATYYLINLCYESDGRVTRQTDCE